MICFTCDIEIDWRDGIDEVIPGDRHCTVRTICPLCGGQLGFRVFGWDEDAPDRWLPGWKEYYHRPSRHEKRALPRWVLEKRVDRKKKQKRLF